MSERLGRVRGVLEVTFLPADPPRAGRLVLYGDLAAAGLVAQEKVELVQPRGDQVRRTQVPALTLPVEEGLAFLLRSADGDPLAGESGPTAGRRLDGSGADDESPSRRAWVAAALAGVGMIGRGRLVPDISPSGFGAWRVAPLDPGDHGWLRNL
ncbi:MAG: hypothetical protein QOH03_3017, partial [Kribbellaceae bacterium]|nr:hypothetical protein [Kribbellaceae bacterium]